MKKTKTFKGGDKNMPLPPVLVVITVVTVGVVAGAVTKAVVEAVKDD